jgi:hypothetical protein
MSGLQVHEAFRKIDPEQARRVVFLTGQPIMPNLPNRCVPKPVPLADLRELISAFLPIRFTQPKR